MLKNTAFSGWAECINSMALMKKRNLWLLRSVRVGVVPTRWFGRTMFTPQEALEILGFSASECQSVFQILAAVLKLGNIQFIPKTNVDGTQSSTMLNEHGQKIPCTSDRDFIKHNWSYCRSGRSNGAPWMSQPEILSKCPYEKCGASQEWADGHRS